MRGDTEKEEREGDGEERWWSQALCNPWAT